MRWPLLTLVGIALAVIVGIVHAAFARTLDCLLDDGTTMDGYAADGYGNR